MMARDSVLDAPSGWTEVAHATLLDRVRVEIYEDLTSSMLDVWADLEAVAPCSIYQTRAWLLPWIETLGTKAGMTPFFIVVRARDGLPLALLCFGVRRAGVKPLGLRVATFLGGKDSNFNMGLIRPGVVLEADDLRELLVHAAGALGPDAPDAFLLLNQPYEWAAQKSPFAALHAQISPSAAFGTALPPSADTLFAQKLSKESRKKLRKKEARLADHGVVSYKMAATPDERATILETFLAQKQDRFRAQGIVSDFDDPRMHIFIAKAAAPGSHGVGIELHALRIDARIVAVYGGAGHGPQWSGMFNSFDNDAEIARSSPGDLLLMHVIKTSCAAGYTRFDLGIGEARYKATLCDEMIPLFDSFVPITLKGWLFLKVQAQALRVKRFVKNDPRAFTLAKRFRAVFRAGEKARRRTSAQAGAGAGAEAKDSKA